MLTQNTNYLNIDQYNSSAQDENAIANQSLSQDFISSGRWKLSCARFNLDTANIPIMFPITLQNQLAILYNDGSTFHEAVSDVDSFLIQESTKSIGGNPVIVSYWQILEALNKALVSAFNDIINQANNSPNPPQNPPSSPPFFRFIDGKLQLLYGNDFQTNQDFYICLNENLNRRTGFQLYKRPYLQWLSFDTSPKQDEWNLVILPISSSGQTHNFFTATTFGQTMENFNDITSLVFRTALPVRQEFNSSDTFSRVLFDFSLEGQIDGDFKLAFTPQGPNREYIFDRLEQRQISTSLFYQLKDGREFPVVLSPGTSFHLKLRFDQIGE